MLVLASVVCIFVTVSTGLSTAGMICLSCVSTKGNILMAVAAVGKQCRKYCVYGLWYRADSYTVLMC